MPHQIVIPDPFIADFDKQYPAFDADRFLPEFLLQPKFEKLKRSVVSGFLMQGTLRIFYHRDRVVYDLVKNLAHEIGNQQQGDPLSQRPISDIERHSVLEEMKAEIPDISEALYKFTELQQRKVSLPKKDGTTQELTELKRYEDDALPHLLEYHRKKRIAIVAAWVNYCLATTDFTFLTPIGKKY